jgi:ParB family chromosome partitioning protein
MAKRPGLGKGLDAIIPGGSSFSDASAQHSAEQEIPIEKIIPNPHQPRSEMNLEELQDLANSIREHGIIQPIIVQPAVNGTYTLIAGERRLRASKLAGLTKIPVILRNASEQEQLELALIENVQRTDLSPLETAEAYRQLEKDFNLKQEEIANRVGKSRVSVTNTLRLLKLPDAAKAALAEGRITEGHARALLQLTTPQAQLAVLDTIIKFEYSVRQTEELVRKYGGERQKKTEIPETLPEIKALEKRIEEKLGMRVVLQHNGDKGKVIIHYFSNEELNNFLDRFFEEQ